jgi:hypothetical protein
MKGSETRGNRKKGIYTRILDAGNEEMKKKDRRQE